MIFNSRAMVLVPFLLIYRLTRMIVSAAPAPRWYADIVAVCSAWHGGRHSFAPRGGNRRHGSLRNRRFLLVKESGTDDPDFVKHIHRQGHQALVEGIWRGGQNRCNDEGA